MLEKTLECPLDSKEIKPINPEGNQPWIFIGRIVAEAEAPIVWPPDAMSWLIGRDPDAGKGRGQNEKGVAEDEMVGWHHWLNGHEFQQAPGDGDRQEGLVYGSPWGCKELDMTERLNWRHICMAESLCCPPETIKTLLFGCVCVCVCVYIYIYNICNIK